MSLESRELSSSGWYTVARPDSAVTLDHLPSLASLENPVLERVYALNGYPLPQLYTLL
ncbi:hypothetical protein OG21DRAFT_683082 [Imleria badia]|nr:hypothetical protein OG21DRAFT_683082 [Imleria badia]